ncbi:MAG: hypothetical protein ABI333_27505 [bacterium]
MALWHVILSSSRRLPMFPTEKHQRAAVRALVCAAPDRLALFGLVKEHGHVALAASPCRRRHIKSAVVQSVGAVAVEPVEVSFCERIEDPKHLRSLVRYFINQSSHHGVKGHPALWSGSCVHELLQTRALSNLRLLVEDLLSDLKSTVLEMVGLPGRLIQPASDEKIRALGATRLVMAAAAALAVGPVLTGHSTPVLLARRAAAQLGRKAGIARDELGWALQVSARALTRLLQGPADLVVEEAVRRRLDLEQAVARSAGAIVPVRLHRRR